MIDNQVFLIFAVPATALLVGIACWELRHQTISPWAAAALLVTGACLGPLTAPPGIAIGTAIGLAIVIMCDIRLHYAPEGGDLRPHVPLVACMAAGLLLVFAFMPPYARAQEDLAGDIGTVTQSERLAAVVLAPDVDPGPPGTDEHMTSLAATEPLTLAEAAARLEALTYIAVEIEERPSRTGIVHPLVDPAPARFDLEGSLVEVVDRLAALYGFRWEWRDTTIVFFRYWDAEFAASTQPVPDVRQARWEIDTDRDATLAEVLERWAQEAGWSLVWSAVTDFALGADAVFEGSFLGAVDALLADPATHATLTATAYQANRRLVVEEAR